MKFFFPTQRNKFIIDKIEKLNIEYSHSLSTLNNVADKIKTTQEYRKQIRKYDSALSFEKNNFSDNKKANLKQERLEISTNKVRNINRVIIKIDLGDIETKFFEGFTEILSREEKNTFYKGMYKLLLKKIPIDKHINISKYYIRNSIGGFGQYDNALYDLKCLMIIPEMGKIISKYLKIDYEKFESKNLIVFKELSHYCDINLPIHKSTEEKKYIKRQNKSKNKIL